jgi:hypothetical protein
MKRYQSIGLGLAVAAMVLFAAGAVPAAQSSARANASSGTTDAIGLIGLLGVLLVTLGAGVRLYDLQRRREQRAMEVQARLSNAFLLASLSGMAITPTVYAPFWSRGPFMIDIAGAVPTPEMRAAAIQLVKRETSGIPQEVHIEDRILVNPRMARYAA